MQNVKLLRNTFASQNIDRPFYLCPGGMGGLLLNAYCRNSILVIQAYHNDIPII